MLTPSEEVSYNVGEFDSLPRRPDRSHRRDDSFEPFGRGSHIEPGAALPDRTETRPGAQRDPCLTEEIVGWFFGESGISKVQPCQEAGLRRMEVHTG